MKRKIERIIVLFLATMILTVTVETAETICHANSNDQTGNREPNMRVQAESIPNDPYWSLQWGLKKIEADWAWNATLGNSSILVAVIDSGIDYTHPDLAANYVGLGYDWINNDTDPMDDYGHGTLVAGVIASQINNVIGIAGLAQVKIMAEKVLDSQGGGFVDQLADGIYHATDQGAKIISMSLSAPSNNSLLYNAVKYAYEKNVLLVAAAGNQAGNTKRYPAAYDEVIAVTATEPDDNRTDFSNFGDWIELAAPGRNIFTTSHWNIPPYGYYDYASGTSMACPFVSGLAALLWSEFPDVTRDWIRTRLRNTADDLGDPGFDIFYGYGRINARKAIYGTSPAVNYTLAITTTAGGTTCPAPENYTYSEGQSVSVQAIPDSGYSLAYWELNGLSAGSNNPFSVLMESNHTLKAVFVPRYTLTITTSTGGTTNPLPASYLYSAGTNVPVTAIANTHCNFDHWELDEVNIGPGNPYSVLMGNNHLLRAVFAPITYSFVIAATNNGTTNHEPGVYNLTAGSSIEVLAIPNPNYTLNYWELDSINIGKTNPLSLTIEANHTLKAIFRLSVFDIAVTKIVLSKTVAGQNYNLNIEVTVVNQGDYTETFNVIAYTNAMIIGTQLVTLTSANSTTLTSTWNTSGFAYGNYTISAYALPVPGEANTANNNFTYNVPVHVGVPGDISSIVPGIYDGKVDMKDIAYLVSLYQTKPNKPNWNPNADANSDDVVDMKDIAIAAIAYFNQNE